MFVSFEGLDGCGKTTQARLLAEALVAEGVEVVSTREPGGTPLGDQIRDLVLHGDHVTPWAEAALYVAARAQHVDQVIRPALERGATVVCDRYLDTSVAYQGAGRELGFDTILELNLLAVGGLVPDRTVLVEIDVETALARVGGRATGSSARGTSSGRASWTRIARLRRVSPSATSSSTAGVRSARSPRRSVTVFADVPEQAEAKRLIEAALADGGRTPTSSTARRASESEGRRVPSPARCSAIRAGSTRERTPICA